MGSQPKNLYILGDEQVDDQISKLAAVYGTPETQELLRQIITTAVKLGSDGASRGDLKVINSSLKELRHSFRVFSPYRTTRKIIVFGSARTKPDHPMYRMAEDFSLLAAQRGFMIISGAGPGIMEAANKGAGKGNSFGVGIKLPWEQEANPYIHGSRQLINFKYFFDRKLIFIKESQATVLFPGGFGTHDEGFENLTLIQTGRSYPRPLIFLEEEGGTYWQGWKKFVEAELLGQGYISEDDLNIFTFCHSAKQAVETIEKFYSVYHSMRYLKDLTVFRVMRPIPKEILKQIGEEFQDILIDGIIENASSSPEEIESDEYPDLPRLVMNFTKKNFGRLYQLIHAINEV